MATVTSLADLSTIAELVEYLGDIPPERIRFRPAPGTATERDVIELHDRENRLFELIDGVLVEKAMGFFESLLAVELARLLLNYVNERDLGLVTGSDGMMRPGPGLVRIPDVSFISWERFPSGFDVNQPIPDLAPDLAVEVLSRSNTQREMDRKCQEYFDSGVRMVWYLDPQTRQMAVYRQPTNCEILGESDLIDGQDVVPGFSVSLHDLFRRADAASSR